MPGNMIFSSNVLKRWSVFPRNSRLSTMFFVISRKMVFLFSRKYYIFSFGGKWKKMIFIKKRVEIWHFLYICVGVFRGKGIFAFLPSWQKRKDTLAPKNTLKGDISGITEKDDIHPRKYGISAEIPHWLTP